MYTKHRWTTDKYFNFGYVKYLPSDFDVTQKYPLIVFLHGAGERGDDLDIAMRHGFMKHVREDGAEYPFIFVAPQCPKEKYWGCYTESLIAFVEEMMNTLPIDPNRVYLSGLSMGGTGTWMLAMACPEKWAAIAPVCGTGIYWNGAILKDVPIHVYHGDCDTTVPITESIQMVSKVNSCGGNAEITIVYGKGHASWEEAYEGDTLWKWLLSHKKEM